MPNTITVVFVVQGGNATAVAACLDAIKNGNASQQNKCTNVAIAKGGSVHINNVRIAAVAPGTQTASGSNTPSSVTVVFVVQGGNATAVAACLDAIKNGNASQQNKCTNVAVAKGGSVHINNVRIAAVL